VRFCASASYRAQKCPLPRGSYPSGACPRMPECDTHPVLMWIPLPTIRAKQDGMVRDPKRHRLDLLQAATLSPGRLNTCCDEDLQPWSVIMTPSAARIWVSGMREVGRYRAGGSRSLIIADI
jgi:hypothetical protein